ncbi:MAG: biotin transporter BioY [Chloroflexi bacterium]|nr:biotin transporter BioY [Chloroflexota bacterium]
MNENVRQPTTMVDVFWVESSAARDFMLILVGSLVVALSARISVPLPFSPVPVTGQTFGVLLVGALLGSRRGALSLLAYLGEGALGLPVFAGGTGGLVRLAGPTGGYLVGFVAAAFLVGRLCERGWDQRLPTAGAAMLLGNAVIYLLGLPWLARFVGPDKVLALGLLPFIPGDLLKITLAALALPGGWALAHRVKEW